MVNVLRVTHLGMLVVLAIAPTVAAQVSDMRICGTDDIPCTGDECTTCADEDCDGVMIEGNNGLFVPICNNDPAMVQALGWTATVYGVDPDSRECCVIRRGTLGKRLARPNLAAANVLNKLDIDGDGLPDDSPDSDGDGLPDNWEEGGVEAESGNTGLRTDRVVFFPAPTPVIPGTPPTPIFTRRAVAASAFNADTDNDGLTDFVEVFGLMYIDDRRDGILENGFEWEDKNGDGLPSPGEFPLNNAGFLIGGINLAHDFDGFVFTDPVNRDTDGDGALDGDFTLEKDPLINPTAFGDENRFTVRFDVAVADIDSDGLGNGMDMGMDLQPGEAAGVDFQSIDNPRNLRSLLELFRQDLLSEERMPEAQIEDLLGADWDGNGLWVTTDVLNWHIVIAEPTDPNADESVVPPAEFFELNPGQFGGVRFYASQSVENLANVFQDAEFDAYGGGVARKNFIEGSTTNDRQPVGIGLGWQELLRPTGTTQFIPDPRVWAILYSWRVPGFDIDGDGFVGVPNRSTTAAINADAVGADAGIARDDADCPEPLGRILGTKDSASAPGVQLTLICEDDRERDAAGRTLRQFDDFINIGLNVAEQDPPGLDGVIQSPCGGPAATGMLLTLMSCVGMRAARRRHR